MASQGAKTLSELIATVWSATTIIMTSTGWSSTWMTPRLIAGSERGAEVRRGIEMGGRDAGRSHLALLRLRVTDIESENGMEEMGGGGRGRGRIIEGVGEGGMDYPVSCVCILSFDLCTKIFCLSDD